jgi:hypothetical protein
LLSIALLITSVVVLAFRKPIQGIFNEANHSMISNPVDPVKNPTPRHNAMVG